VTIVITGAPLLTLPALSVTIAETWCVPAASVDVSNVSE